MHSAFSERQIDILRDAMWHLGEKAVTGPGHARCRACAASQVCELKCLGCGKMKGIDAFSKTQRGDRDTAVSS